MTDAERFDAIYREYRQKVHDYIRNRVNSPEDAEDLCSEVFRKAMENMNTQRGTGMSSYIYTITRNTVVDYYRTHRVHAPLTEDIPQGESMEDAILSNDSLEFQTMDGTPIAWLSSDASDGLGVDLIQIGSHTTVSQRWIVKTDQNGDRLTFTRRAS